MEFGTNAHNLAPLKDNESEPYFTIFTFLVQRMDISPFTKSCADFSSLSSARKEAIFQAQSVIVETIGM